MDSATEAAMKLVKTQTADAKTAVIQQHTISNNRSLKQMAFIWCGIVVMVRAVPVFLPVFLQFLIDVGDVQVVLLMQCVQRARRGAELYEETELYESELYEGDEEWEEEEEEEYDNRQYRSFQNSRGNRDSKGRATGELDLGDASEVC
jgi:hypothetical protein